MSQLATKAHQTGVPSYDRVSFSHWRPECARVVVKDTMRSVYKTKPAHAAGPSEVAVPPLSEHVFIMGRKRARRLVGHVDGLPVNRIMPANSFNVLPRGSASHWSMTPSSVDDVHHLHFPQATLDQLTADQGTGPRAFALALCAEDQRVAAVVDLIEAELRSGNPPLSLFWDAAAILLARLLLERGRPSAPRDTARGGLAAWQSRIVQDYMHEYLADDIRLSDLAAMARLSPFHFSRCFKKTFGMAPFQYQTKLRISQACHLLAVTDRSITDVAWDVGYESPQSLARVFRKLVGVSPSVFRQSAADPGQPAPVGIEDVRERPVRA